MPFQFKTAVLDTDMPLD